METNIIVIINSDIDSVEIIQKAINDRSENKNIYLIASPNVRFIHETIKRYEYTFKDWTIQPIDTEDKIIRVIQNFKLIGKTIIYPTLYSKYLNSII